VNRRRRQSGWRSARLAALNRPGLSRSSLHELRAPRPESQARDETLLQTPPAEHYRVVPVSGAIEPPHAFERRDLRVVEAASRATRVNHFRLEQTITDSASALSYESPRLPTDGSTPAARRLSV
jgi:hypothetical protein